ncbi:MAG: AMP-binding protein, partial [Micromonosporaceae bacterium]
MPDFLTQLRDTVAGVPTAVESVRVLRRAGLVRLNRPDEMLRSLVAVRMLGPFAGAVRIAARRDPRSIGLVDERGPLTFTELDHRSNALARAWRARGLAPGDAIGLLCRDHRGLLDSILAAAKLGVRGVLLNTGFAGRQLADVAAREGISAIVYDEEFSPTVEALPDAVARYLGWVDEAGPGPKAEVAGPGRKDVAAGAGRKPAGVPAIEDLIRDTDDGDVRAPREPGGIVLLTSGTTGTPKGAPRQVRSALAAAEFLDRVPYRRNEATAICSPLFHATGLSQLVITLALASTTVLSRRFDGEAVLSRIAQYRCTGLVVVPTMLQRILDLGEDVLSRYDTSSLRILFTAGSALSPELGNRASAAFGEVIYNLYGSTEVAVATIATPDDWRSAPGTVGSPPVGCRVHLYDRDGNRVQAPYRQGQI